MDRKIIFGNGPTHLSHREFCGNEIGNRQNETRKAEYKEEKNINLGGTGRVGKINKLPTAIAKIRLAT